MKTQGKKQAEGSVVLIGLCSMCQIHFSNFQYQHSKLYSYISPNTATAFENLHKVPGKELITTAFLRNNTSNQHCRGSYYKGIKFPTLSTIYVQLC